MALTLTLLALLSAAPCTTVPECVESLRARSASLARPGDDVEVQGLTRTLARFGDEAVEPLRALLRQPDPSAQAVAVRALGQLGPRARRALPELLEALEGGVPDAGWALGALADPGAAKALQVAVLRRAGAADARALTQLGRPGFEALGALFAAPELSERAALTALEAFREGGTGIEAAMPALRTALEVKGRPSFVRAYAAASLGEMGSSGLEAAPSLRDLVRDPSPVIQQAALDALAQLGDRTVVTPLMERLGAPEGSTRLGAFTGLAHLGPLAKPAVPALLTALAASDFEQRALAAEALGWIRETSAVPPLLAVLRGNSWSASEQAALALGRIGSAAALTALREVSQRHWSQRVRRAASTAAREVQHVAGRTRPRHDFREVESARRILAALSESESCPGSRETGWQVTHGGTQLTVRPEPAEEDVSALLPSVLPPVRLGRDDGFRERTHGRSVEDGWLVARDAGEWGGTLWFVGWDGKKSKLADHAVEGFVKCSFGLMGLGGLPHRSRSAGVLWRMERSSEGQWRAEPLVELPGAPVAWQVRDDGTLLVVTQAGAVALLADGGLQPLGCAGLSKPSPPAPAGGGGPKSLR